MVLLGERTVVLGASVGGLPAARALTDHETAIQLLRVTGMLDSPMRLFRPGFVGSRCQGQQEWARAAI
ncbi:MAG: hypothetical protein ACSLFA_12780 [Mycobacterium sp.]